MLINNIIINFNVSTYKISNTKLLSDIKKMSVLSKIVYDYDFSNRKLLKQKKDNFFIKPEFDKKTNLTIDFIKNNNIYFDSSQYASFLNNNNFIKPAEKHLDFINNNFPNTEIYGYFNNKNRLHLLIFLNHNLSEINVIFRGSQYIDEWINNIKINEVPISFNNKFKIHRGLYQIYTNYNIDNNIIYILKNLFDYFPKYRKIFSGHSRATTFCFLMVMELLSKLKDKYKYEIICFGNPQILNKQIANFLHSNKNIDIYNVINENDIISYLPFCNKYQVGTEILLKDSINNLSIIKHKYPYQKKLNIFNFFKSIDNHDLIKYIEKLKNIKL
jgi:hypothetical protein